MKKSLALIAVLAAGITLASAAPVLSLHGSVGEGWGTTFANETANNYVKPFGNNLDFNFGVGLNFSIGGYFGIQPEVNVAINNAGYQTSDSNAYPNVVSNYVSIDIPLLLTIRYNKFNFLVGPYVSFPLGEMKTTYNLSDSSVTEGASAISNAPFTVWGLTVGGGYEERLGIGRLVFGVRYSLDFTPIKTTTTVGPINVTGEYFTRRALYIDISYKFALDF